MQYPPLLPLGDKVQVYYQHGEKFLVYESFNLSNGENFPVQKVATIPIKVQVIYLNQTIQITVDKLAKYLNVQHMKCTNFRLRLLMTFCSQYNMRLQLVLASCKLIGFHHFSCFNHGEMITRQTIVSCKQICDLYKLAKQFGSIF